MANDLSEIETTAPSQSDDNEVMLELFDHANKHGLMLKRLSLKARQNLALKKIITPDHYRKEILSRLLNMETPHSKRGRHALLDETVQFICLFAQAWPDEDTNMREVLSMFRRFLRSYFSTRDDCPDCKRSPLPPQSIEGYMIQIMALYSQNMLQSIRVELGNPAPKWRLEFAAFERLLESMVGHYKDENEPFKFPAALSFLSHILVTLSVYMGVFGSKLPSELQQMIYTIALQEHGLRPPPTLDFSWPLLPGDADRYYPEKICSKCSPSCTYHRHRLYFAVKSDEWQFDEIHCHTREPKFTDYQTQRHSSDCRCTIPVVDDIDKESLMLCCEQNFDPANLLNRQC